MKLIETLVIEDAICLRNRTCNCIESLTSPELNVRECEMGCAYNMENWFILITPYIETLKDSV